MIVLLMMWLMGVFHPKVAQQAPPPPGRPAGDVAMAAVRLIHVPIEESAVGSIRPVHEAAIASKILARVVDVRVRAGQPVEAGELVVQLDDQDLQARRQQAVAAVDAIRAARNQALTEHDRIQRLFEQNAASRIELDRAITALKSAEAELLRAEQMLKEAQTLLEYSVLRSPLDGIVVDKKVDAGDTVSPGQVLLTVYNPARMQLVASVRESLALQLEVGRTVPVRVDALDLLCDGDVSEIVPEAEASTRSFAVKVTGPCPPGVYAGMFGRLIIRLDEQQAVLAIPPAAIRRVGQLDVVDVADHGLLRRRAVQLGRIIEHEGERLIQVLAGLHEGEQVAL
jgi:membrane fusion protein, multidrug efflux system